MKNLSLCAYLTWVNIMPLATPVLLKRRGSPKFLFYYVSLHIVINYNDSILKVMLIVKIYKYESSKHRKNAELYMIYMHVFYDFKKDGWAKW